MLAIILFATSLWAIAFLAIVLLLVLIEYLSPKLGLSILLLFFFLSASWSIYKNPSEIKPAAVKKETQDSIPDVSVLDTLQIKKIPLKEKPAPKKESPPNTKKPEVIPTNTSPVPTQKKAAPKPETFPPLNPHVKLQMKGIKDKIFLQNLGKAMGYEFARKGTFIIEINFTGQPIKDTNTAEGKIQWNYPKGSIVAAIDGYPCITEQVFLLPETNYSGKKLRELQEDLEKRKLELLQKNLQEVAKRLQACIPK